MSKWLKIFREGAPSGVISAESKPWLLKHLSSCGTLPKSIFLKTNLKKRLNFGHFCSYVLNSAKKSHMIWNFQRRYFLMGILCKLTPWRWHHSKYPMPKLDLEFSFKFQKSNLFYSSTLTKCSNQHSISRVIKPQVLSKRDWYETTLFPWEQHMVLETKKQYSHSNCLSTHVWSVWVWPLPW